MAAQPITKAKVASLTVATLVFALVAIGWARDRYVLNKKIQKFDFSIGKQSVSEYCGPLKASSLKASYYVSETESVETSVTLEQLVATPTWDAKDGNPPISARQAIKLANEAASKMRVWDESNWEFYEISLTRMDTGATDRSYWCWQAHYRGGVDGRTIKSCEIWVLLNGSVITPKEVQKEIPSKPDITSNRRLAPKSFGQLI